jgi:hypothetical protein
MSLKGMAQGTFVERPCARSSPRPCLHPLSPRGSYLGRFPGLTRVDRMSRVTGYQARRFHRRFRPAPFPRMFKTTQEPSMRPIPKSRDERKR